MTGEREIIKPTRDMSAAKAEGVGRSHAQDQRRRAKNTAKPAREIVVTASNIGPA